MEIEAVEIDEPGATEVLVRMAASGVCHSDQSVALGLFPVPLPMVLGHEGSGVVEAVGRDVTRCKVGDHVVLSLLPQCGDCFWCRKGQAQLCAPAFASTMAGVLADGTPRLRSGDEPVYQFQGLGTFSEFVVTQEKAVVPIDIDVPLDVVALVGCAVITGVGAVLNTASVERGDTVLVIGAGGVGLNVVQGARLAGADRIVAVDLHQSKLAMAQQFGATDAVVAGDDAAEAILEMTSGRGVDVAFDVVGAVPTTDLAMASVRRGGQVCVVGMAGIEVRYPVQVALDLLIHEKRLFGTNIGSTNTSRDIPRLIDWYKSGDLLLDELVGQRITLGELDGAFEAMDGGTMTRSLIVYG